MQNRGIVWIFDLDGTLFESHHQIIFCVNKARVAFGYDRVDEGVLLNKIGPPVNALFDDLELDSQHIDDIVWFFREELREVLMRGTPLYEGSEALLEMLKKSGYFTAIATTKPDDLALQMVELSPLSGLVNFVKGSTGIQPKPNPEVILRVLEKLGVQSGVMVGDRMEDIEAANAAGLPSIGIAQSSHSQMQLADTGAMYTFRNIDELREAISSDSLRIPVGY
jgi:phosphoglycolate phosphatase-like HAD superfamily hydrolase